MSAARLLDLGRKPYREVWQLQHTLHERVREGEEPETWIAVEHEPVVTLGRSAKSANLLLPREALLARGIDVVEIERGGDVTYHGPGQLVVYPIRRLERFREVVPLVRALEEAVIQTCAAFGIEGSRWSEHAGVWVGRNQICAIGLAVRKMTSLHGIAFNVSTQLDYDRLINPCGLTDRGLTSLSNETHRLVSLSEAKTVLFASFERVFRLQFVPARYEDEEAMVAEGRVKGGAELGRRSDDEASSFFARREKASVPEAAMASASAERA